MRAMSVIPGQPGSATVALAGISAAERVIAVNLDRVQARMVVENTVMFGTVNAARRNYEQAVAALAKADPEWLAALISRRVPLSSWTRALDRRPGDVKVTVDLTR